jgi:alpha-amylase/alpha-mannosidase (GH57 family)
MTRVAILWHMHQPYYEDLVTREHILPWVRLHALKDYYGMVALLREFPDVRMTFNLVPSLLVQLEAFAADRARDRSLELSLKPAGDLEEHDIEFMVEHFFHAQRQRMIDIYPRYAELLARRGGSMPPAADRRAAGARFSRTDLRDLQVWHKLAWIDPFYLDTDPRVRRLVAKGRGFSEDDKTQLRQVELELLNRVIPEYRDAAARGQIEISVSPFYHPILPLLCDTNIYLRTHPDSRMPRERFVHPEDAAEQLTRATAYYERLFGRRAVGLWPSEGSVSDAIIPLAAAAGFKWLATDELILARTMNATFSRDGRGHVQQPEWLYTPYRVRIGAATVTAVFRDHVLSDLIGFTYAGWNADAAADDFVGRLVEAGRRYRDRTGGREALVSIILDGENAWEHFEGGGRPFLRALYRRLSSHRELRTVTMAEGCATAERELTSIFPGSWIDANFYIWIGHADDQRAWTQLSEARAALDTATVGSPAADRAREEILVAEGSDWFWWYGDDHSSAHDLEFDDLFRRHLRNAYRLMDKPVPDELFVSNISAGAATPLQTNPTALFTPTLDGEETSYFEWLGAGTLEIRDLAGAMHQASRREPLLTLVQFGFDDEHLYVRVDATRPLVDLLADGYEVSLKFLQPDGVRFSVRQTQGRLTGLYWDRRVETRPDQATRARWLERGPGRAAVAAGTVLEVSLPLADLAIAARATAIAFFVAVYADDQEAERHPAHRPIDLLSPDPLFEARHWRA